MAIDDPEARRVPSKTVLRSWPGPQRQLSRQRLLPCKPGDLSLIPEAYGKMGREKQLHKSVLQSLRMLIVYRLLARVRRTFRAFDSWDASGVRYKHLVGWSRSCQAMRLGGPTWSRHCCMTDSICAVSYSVGVTDPFFLFPCLPFLSSLLRFSLLFPMVGPCS